MFTESPCAAVADVPAQLLSPAAGPTSCQYRGNPPAPSRTGAKTGGCACPSPGAAASQLAARPRSRRPKVVQIARLPRSAGVRHPCTGWMDPLDYLDPAGRRRPDRATTGRRLFPDGDLPAGRCRPPAPARRALSCRSAAPNSRPRSGTTPGPPARARPDTTDSGCGNHPPRHHLACNHGHGGGFIRHRTVRFDGHPTLPVAAIEDVVLHAMTCLAPPASTAIATSAMRLHGVPLELLKAQLTADRSGPALKALHQLDLRAESIVEVDAQHLFRVPRNWLRRAGLPARDRPGRLPDRGVPDCRGGWLRVPLQPRGPAPGPGPEQRLHTGRLRRAPVHARAHLVRTGARPGRDPGRAGPAFAARNKTP